MPYACTRKSASGDDIDVPAGSKPQLSGHISSRTPCTRMRTQA
jgi:hypothetical protein